MKRRTAPEFDSLSFEDAARIVRGRPGAVVLESSLPSPDALSLLASDPEFVLTGDAGDWPRLEAELARRERRSAALNFPDGAAVGWVGFDGRFCFGFYDSLYIHHPAAGCWLTPPPAPGPVVLPKRAVMDFRPTLSREAYLAMVRRALEYIAAGDIYQVCLAHEFEAAFSGDAWSLHESLRLHSPAPFAAFLDLGGRQVVSASPELFLRLSGRRILTRPIKGTRPRGADPQRDQRNAYDLITSTKEIAELVMITDLERNDLGQVCRYGSVTVSDLLKLESFAQVHHLVSTVQGILRPDVSHAAALRACLPGGSISGAPKKRAIEIITELEPRPRGLYTGAIGYFGYNGESQFAMAIRTAAVENGRASFHVGAGIVADSVPEREWQETLDKAAGLLVAAGGSGRRA